METTSKWSSNNINQQRVKDNLSLNLNKHINKDN